MSRRHHRHGFVFRLKSLYIWHRVIGLTCALFVLFLSVTGIALNRTEQWSLDEQFLSHPLLLKWYGIKVEPPQHGYLLGEHWLSQLGETLYLDQLAISGQYGALVSAAANQQLILAATAQQLVALTAQGELIDHWRPTEIDGSIVAVAINDYQRITIKTTTDLYQSNSGWTNWQPTKEGPTGSSMRPLPQSIIKGISSQAGAHELTLERVTLDLHSGRLMGKHGPLIMDLAAFGLIFLSLSGTIIWIKQSLRNRRSQQQD